jgi:hypothetical protein
MSMDYRLIRLCRGDGYTVVPQEIVDLDLPGSAEALRGAGFSVLRHDILLVAERDGYRHTMYRSGRMLIEPTPGTREEAGLIADELFRLLRRH